jgi:hypothetical protein
MPRVENHYGSFIIYGRGRGKEGELVQTDWDFPSAAQGLGWSLSRVQKRGGKTVFLARKGKGCDHGSTDGTVNCKECGVTASEFINAAREFLEIKT